MAFFMLHCFPWRLHPGLRQVALRVPLGNFSGEDIIYVDDSCDHITTDSNACFRTHERKMRLPEWRSTSSCCVVFKGERTFQFQGFLATAGILLDPGTPW